MQAELWSDYVCPWCYLGRDRTELLESLGVSVTHRAFELHPEFPPEGITVRAGGRLAATLDHIGAECVEAGLPFCRPQRLPNSRRALETAEVVAAYHPHSFGALDALLFEAVFVSGLDIADPEVLCALVRHTGAPDDDVHARVGAGEGARLLARSMDDARAHGIAGTPTWRLETGLVIPGVQSRELLTRWIERIRARAH